MTEGMMASPRPVALITGASRGIGSATARELGRRGYHVIVNYRVNADAARATVAAIESGGGTAAARAADICDLAQARALTDAVTAECGRIDVLVCNANTGQPSFAPLQSLAWDDFIGTVTGELAGAFFITQSVLEVMRLQGHGQIIYISSTAADFAGPGRLSQSTAKSALNTFSRNVAAEAGRHGITVNTVAPGAVRTEASAGMLTAEREDHLRRKSVLGRMVEPHDVAVAVAMLAGDTTRAVTGAVIRVDAGYGVLAGGPSSRA
jgi:3-oxoacyl-[acyl-carrier protein] reductase